MGRKMNLNVMDISPPMHFEKVIGSYANVTITQTILFLSEVPARENDTKEQRNTTLDNISARSSRGSWLTK